MRNVSYLTSVFSLFSYDSVFNQKFKLKMNYCGKYPESLIRLSVRVILPKTHKYFCFFRSFNWDKWYKLHLKKKHYTIQRQTKSSTDINMNSLTIQKYIRNYQNSKSHLTHSLIFEKFIWQNNERNFSKFPSVFF